jgi:hypothetical protein
VLSTKSSLSLQIKSFIVGVKEVKEPGFQPSSGCQNNQIPKKVAGGILLFLVQQSIIAIPEPISEIACGHGHVFAFI